VIRDAIDSLPLFNVLLVTVALVLVTIEIGYRIGAWRIKEKVFDSEAQLSSMTGANLALLAFIMAFSFSLAGSHHDKRKVLILDEANAIGTAYLRAGLIDPTHGETIRRLLQEYTAVRARLADDHTQDPRQAIEDSVELQILMWRQLEEIAQNDSTDGMDVLLVRAINDLFDLHERRVAAGLRNRIPSSIWVALLSLLGLSMLGMGHFSGLKGARNPVSTTALALSFSMVIFIIADLDRHNAGLVTTDQSAILELNQRLSKSPR
jgi:hypothetical protein